MSLHKIRILFIIHSLGFGGAERVVTDMVKNLDSDVYDATVCTFCETPGFAAEFEKTGVAVHVLEKKSRFDLLLLVKLTRLIRELRPDVVCMHCRDAFHFGAPASLLAGVPVRIATEHSVGSGTNRFLNRLAFRFFSRTWSATVAVSQFLKDFMVEAWGLSPARIEVIYNGIDFARLDASGDDTALRRELALPPQALIVGNVGTLKAEKGHGAFLEAAAEIASKNQSAQFVVIGDGPLMSELASGGRALGLGERLHWMGTRQDALRLAAGFDIFLCTSQVETFGLAAVEAMYLGVPIVSFEVGSMKEIVTDNEDGFLVPPGDTALAAARVLSLLEDPALRERMGKCARESVGPRFSLQRMIREYERLISAQ